MTNSFSAVWFGLSTHEERRARLPGARRVAQHEHCLVFIVGLKGEGQPASSQSRLRNEKSASPYLTSEFELWMRRVVNAPGVDNGMLV